MDIIQYLLSVTPYLYQQNCWLINFICRYIPLATDFRQDWTYKELIPYYEKRYG